MYKLKTAVLSGGCSKEHDVSVKSTMEIAANINKKKYQLFYTGTTKPGAWRLYDRPCQDWENYAGSPTAISPDRRTHGLLVQQNGGYKSQPVGVAFPMTHGKFGEDRTIQGLFELSGISHVGRDTQSSVICMDKSLAYMVVKNAGIKVPGLRVLQKGDDLETETLSYLIFIKPVRSGSSFGADKMCRIGEPQAAVIEAGRYDSKVLVEESVSGSEVGCAILGVRNDLIVGEADQIGLKHGLFKIHQEVQPEKGSESVVIRASAALPDEVRGQIQETVKKIHRALGCRGLVRVDLLLQEDGSIVLNEVNTMPGFTSYNHYPRMTAAAGFTLPGILDLLIGPSLRR